MARSSCGRRARQAQQMGSSAEAARPLVSRRRATPRRRRGGRHDPEPTRDPSLQKPVFTAIGVIYVALAASALARGTAMLRDFRVPEA